MDTQVLLNCILAMGAVSTAIPVLPVIQEFTRGMSRQHARNYALTALFSANAVAVAFLAAAPLLFGALGLTVNDLRVAGGIVLLVYATHDILFSRAQRVRSASAEDDSFEPMEPPPSIAPLGIPILVGPATLSTLLVLGETYGSVPALVGLLVGAMLNVVLVLFMDRLLGVMGDGASRAVGKVNSLILATLGAGMLRVAITEVLGL